MLSSADQSAILQWVLRFKLSSPIRKLSRDLSDGVLVAEILHQLFPRLVDLHNYTKGFAIVRKLDNWDTLNRKVLRKLEIHLTPDILHDVANGVQGVIYEVLLEVMIKAELYSTENKAISDA